MTKNIFQGADKMKKLLSILIAVILAASVFTSCSSDEKGNDEEQSQATIEQLKKFESGWWWIFETERYVDYNNDNEESYYYECYLIKYDPTGEHTGEYFGEKCGWDGDKDNLVCTSLDIEKSSWGDSSDLDAFNSSWFPPINYNIVSKYLEKEFGRKDKDVGYMYTTYILKKASTTDEGFPNWATKE